MEEKMFKFLKKVATDILMIPVIIEVGIKVRKGKELKDEDLSCFAKWVVNLLELEDEPTA